MSELSIFADDKPDHELMHSTDGDEIAAELAAVGIRFERWQAGAQVKAGDSPEQVMAAYKDDIDQLIAEEGYQTVDVISLDATDNA